MQHTRGFQLFISLVFEVRTLHLKLRNDNWWFQNKEGIFKLLI